MTPLSIGQVAKRVGMTVEAIRFYEREGLLAEATRKPSGYRQFTEETVARLAFIRRAKELGFTLREVRALLGLWCDPTATREEVRERVEAKIAEIEAEIASLAEKEEGLRELCATCRGSGPAHDCPIMLAIARPDERRAPIQPDVGS